MPFQMSGRVSFRNPNARDDAAANPAGADVAQFKTATDFYRILDRMELVHIAHNRCDMRTRAESTF
jgi:hypothetical protein